MVATIELPKLDTLQALAKEIPYYPITGLGVAQWAEHLGYSDDVVEFIKLYSEKIVFNSRTDLLNHCRLLEKLLIEERKSVKEYIRSPQD
jgi:hypothetical protein